MKKKTIRINIGIQKWYHFFFDYIMRKVRRRRKLERDVTFILNVKFTKDWKFIKVKDLYFKEHKIAGDNNGQKSEENDD
jgi:hypothetical protein